jgi:hypothetical protein
MIPYILEKMGKGLANLKSLEDFTIHFEEEPNGDEPTSRADFGILVIVLPYLRQELVFDLFGPAACSREEVEALARAICLHPTIKEFNTGY